MPVTFEQVSQDALGLPVDGRAELVQKLLASLAGKASLVVEAAHLKEVGRRRAAVNAGQSSLIDGPEAHHVVRAALRQ